MNKSKFVLRVAFFFGIIITLMSFFLKLNMSLVYLPLALSGITFLGLAVRQMRVLVVLASILFFGFLFYYFTELSFIVIAILISSVFIEYFLKPEININYSFYC
jgi:hypothetical protein